MKNPWCTVLAVLSLTAMSQVPAKTDGCYMPTDRQWRQQREKSMINEPEQKALIVYDKGREQLIISPGFSGSSNDFAWVVPVPSRPKIEILQGAPFHELARLVEPEPNRLKQEQKSMAPSARAGGVTVIERKTIGDYEVSVLTATDSQALVHWLRDNGYHMPHAAEGPVRTYTAEHWTFVASKIKLHDRATGLKTGTLTPLRLTFDSPGPIYPMRLSGANSSPFTVLVYIALPLNNPASTSIPLVLKTIKAPSAQNLELSHAKLSSESRPSYPTLSRLSGTGLQVYWLEAHIAPAECDKDFVWAVTPN